MVIKSQLLLEKAMVSLSEESQIELYDLAFSRAELMGALVMLDYAERDAPVKETALKESLALMFSAESVSNFYHRLRLRPTSYGLTLDDLGDDYVELSEKYLAPEYLVRVGNMIRDRGGTLPLDHLDPEKAMIRDTFRKFSREHVEPLAEKIHREDTLIPPQIIEGLRELGCFGLSVPARYGGLKPDDREDSLSMVIVTEELSRGSLGAAGSLITRPEIMTRALIEGGTEKQKERWLPGIAAGSPLCAISVTEPGTGSDVAAVALKATKVDNGWTLNGGKTWCTLAGKAGLILVLARTNSDARPPHRGLSLFVVEKPEFDGRDFEFNEPFGGRLSGRAIPTIGYRGMHSFEMFFDEFFVPDDALVGESRGKDMGFYYTMQGFAGGRLQTAARATGLIHAAFDSALTYAEERNVFDRQVASFPLTLSKLARMFMYTTVCQQFSYSVAKSMDEGGGQIEASLVKLFACRAAERVTREAMQIHGGMGYAEEVAVSRYFVDARVLSIFEGSEEALALRVISRV